MAKKTTQQPPETPLFLTMTREEATRCILDRIKKGEEIRGLPINNAETLDDVKKKYYTWDEYNQEMLIQMFTSPKISDEYSRRAGITVIYEKSLSEEIRGIWESIDSKIRKLNSISERLELIPVVPGVTLPKAKQASLPSNQSKKIFVVHGHDEAVKEAVARFITKLDLEPIILHEQPSQGRTVVEKLEAHGDVGFTVVLLTPDDIGGEVIDRENLHPRARQNVVLELGYFIGRLGRENVCAMYKGELELPSDYMGVIYVPYDRAGGWRLNLAKEIKAAGFSVDMNRAI